MGVTLDLGHEALNFSETTVDHVTDERDNRCGMVRIHLAVESAPSVTLYLPLEDARFLAACMEHLLEGVER